MKVGEPRLSPLAERVFSLLSWAISSNGNLIATRSWSETRLWNAHTGAPIGRPLRGREILQTSTTNLIFTSDDQRLALVTLLVAKTTTRSIQGCVIVVWDVKTGREVHNLLLPPILADMMFTIKTPTSANYVDISSDGRSVAVGNGVDVILLWQIKSNLEALEPLRAAKSEYRYSLRFSPDGEHLVSCGESNSARIRNISTGQLVSELAGHTGPVTRIIYSPDGRLIATASKDKTIRLWNAMTGMSAATLDWHGASVQLLGFADAGSLVSGHEDGTIRVWDVNAARLLFSEDAEDDSRTFSAATLKDGWLIGPLGELLMWIPIEYRAYLHIPPCTQIVANQRVSIKLGEGGWHRGLNWTSCWRGGDSKTVSDAVWQCRDLS